MFLLGDGVKIVRMALIQAGNEVGIDSIGAIHGRLPCRCGSMRQACLAGRKGREAWVKDTDEQMGRLIRGQEWTSSKSYLKSKPRIPFTPR